jgi:hypothetical protein
LSEPYILIINALVLSVGNYVLWWLIFDEEFEHRLQTYQKVQKTELVKENEEFVNQMQGIIELDPEAIEVVGFGEKWQQQLGSVNKIRNESEILKDQSVWVYYVSIIAILLAAIGIAVPDGIRITQDLTLYITAISWWIIVGGVLLMMGLLTIYQLIELKSVPKTQGTPIKNESVISRTISNLRNRNKN